MMVSFSLTILNFLNGVIPITSHLKMAAGIRYMNDKNGYTRTIQFDTGTIRLEILELTICHRDLPEIDKFFEATKNSEISHIHLKSNYCNDKWIKLDSKAGKLTMNIGSIDLGLDMDIDIPEPYEELYQAIVSYAKDCDTESDPDA